MMAQWFNCVLEQRQQAARTPHITFGNVTVTFRATSGGTIGWVWYKALLVHDARMAADGIAIKEPERE